MKLLRIVAFSVVLALFGAAACLAADLSQVVRTLEQGYATLNDLQADFSQRSMIRTMKHEEKGGGELFLKKGGGKDSMFRFNYTKPKQQIVSNGKKVWYYLPDQKQAMVVDLAQLYSQGNGVALNYLAGLGRISKDFNISFVGNGRDKKGDYLLELIPKKPTPTMTKLQLTVEGAAVEAFVAKGKPSTPFPVLSSTVTDQIGNTTRIEFSNVKTNRGLDSGKFHFKVPAGVEIVKTR